MPTAWSLTMWTTGWRATDGDPRSRAGEDPEPASYLKGASQPKQVRRAYAGVETSLAIFTASASATVTAGPLRFSYTPYVAPGAPRDRLAGIRTARSETGATPDPIPRSPPYACHARTGGLSTSQGGLRAVWP